MTRVDLKKQLIGGGMCIPHLGETSILSSREQAGVYQFPWKLINGGIFSGTKSFNCDTLRGILGPKIREIAPREAQKIHP